jgi:hypothetical protein
MTINKKIPINYFARDFNSIKDALVEHTKRYYPETFKDFNEASFGSLMLDTVSYVGDILSFYLDYQANESFLQTSNEFQNVVKLARQMGYKLDDTPTAHGIATFFILVPATPLGDEPDQRYIPVLKRGSTFSTPAGSQFILNEEVRFDKNDNEVVVGRVSENGNVTHYAIKSYGQVISGRFESITVSVGQFKRFLKLDVGMENVSEIISVVDLEGNEYFEVDYLSQDVIYRPIANRTETKKDVNSFLRPYSVPRRFVVEKDGTSTYLQFGFGIDSTDFNKDREVDPSSVILKYHSKEYISDSGFDPSNLLYSDKFGIVPENTQLRITARINDFEDVNAGVDSLTEIGFPNFEFDDDLSLDRNLRNSVVSSLEVTNEEPIVGKVDVVNADEIKMRALHTLSTQNRAVTREDYKSLIYKMPNEYGSIKRVNVLRDQDSFKRNLNIYVISEDSSNKLIETNSTVKNNVKIWLNSNRMINDTIDILDAKILNIGVDFSIIADLERDKYETLNNSISALTAYFSRPKEIGESIFLTDIVKTIKDVDGVIDVVDVQIVNKTSGNYPGIYYDLYKYLSSDGRYIEVPENVIFEVRFPSSDLKGVVV